MEETEGAVCARSEVSRMTHRILAGVTADDVPALPHDGAEKEEDHDVEGVGAFHKGGKEIEDCQRQKEGYGADRCPPPSPRLNVW